MNKRRNSFPISAVIHVFATVWIGAAPATAACVDGDLPCFRSSDPWFRENLLIAPRDLFMVDQAAVRDAFDYENLAGINDLPDGKERTKLLVRVAGGGEALLSRYVDETRGKSCAVVGSAGNVIGAGYAALIDSNDVVFRMNDAPVKGFESAVGSKSTIRVLNSVNMFADSPDQLLVHRSPVRASKMSPGFLKGESRRLLMTGSAIEKRAQRFFPRRTQTTGVMAILVALQTCRCVEVFGFGPNRRGEYDYYFPHAGPLSDFHSKREQERFIAELARRKIIFYHAGLRRKPSRRSN